jgi:LysM repeat protein
VLAIIGMVTSMASIVVWPAATSASYVDVLANGGFEQGFTSQPGCGMVGSGWQCFTNGGAANYGFYDDQWERTVLAGNHSQLIEVNTKGIMQGDSDRYAGVYQTVAVQPWAAYSFNLSGMIRTTELEGDPWRYRVQVGWTQGPSANWQSVTNWTDVGWDTYYERTNPGSFSSFGANVTAEADYLTIYIRVWKKWGVGYQELDVNLDAISLTGPSPYYQQPVHPIYPEQPVIEPVAPGCVDPCVQPQPLPQPLPVTPVAPGCVMPCVQPLPPVGVCAGPELVYNGSFESGFNPVAVGHVGNSWGYFTNGGAANYGFYDDQWPRVVADGQHSQLIEINTKSIFPADNDRYAGIYQYITGLYPGVTYEFRMKGVLRGAGNEDDPYRFAAQVGYASGYQADWTKVSNWNEMNLGPIGVRTDPGPMTEWTMKFTAPASDVTLFIRGWKKWAITNVEMDFNIDSVSLRGCLLYGTGGPVAEPYAVQPMDAGYAPDYGSGYGPDYGYDKGHDKGHKGYDQGYSEGYGYDGGGQAVCSYTVQPGDTLAWVAQSMGVGQYELIAANGIANPDFIYVGQVLSNPSCGAAGGYGLGAAPADSYVAADYAAADYELAATANYDMAGYDMAGAGDYGAMAGDYPAGDYAASGFATGDYAAGDMTVAYGAQEYPAGPDWQGAGEMAAALPAAGGGSYTVAAGDNLSRIAANYGIPVDQLLQANGIQNPNIIYVGQQLVIP